MIIYYSLLLSILFSCSQKKERQIDEYLIEEDGKEKLVTFPDYPELIVIVTKEVVLKSYQVKNESCIYLDEEPTFIDSTFMAEIPTVESITRYGHKDSSYEDVYQEYKIDYRLNNRGIISIKTSPMMLRNVTNVVDESECR